MSENKYDAHNPKAKEMVHAFKGSTCRAIADWLEGMEIDKEWSATDLQFVIVGSLRRLYP